jgi:hypothetical protein
MEKTPEKAGYSAFPSCPDWLDRRLFAIRMSQKTGSSYNFFNGREASPPAVAGGRKTG